jgi:RimJ/RimL family protein N-acetyltransferase
LIKNWNIMQNKQSRPVGAVVDPLPPGKGPDLRPLHGRWVRLDALNVAKHADQLFVSFSGAVGEDDIWTYMPYGPFKENDGFVQWLTEKEASRDPWFYAFVKRDGSRALGMGAFMRLDASNGVIEIGHIWFAPELQRTRDATEVIFLLLRHGFDDLGVRRLEWKCDSLNAASRRAALRFGFSFEGVFRQHYIIKGRNRDTAWFSLLDSEWPSVRKAFEIWMKDENFDAQGCQKAKLQVKQEAANPRASKR